MAAQLTSEMGHLSEAEAAAYLDRGLPLAERDRLEDHLASCPDCRAQLIEARRILAHVRRPTRSVLIGSIAAAAAAVLIFLPRPAAHPAEKLAPATVMRGSVEATRLVAYGPTGETHARALRFVWSAAPGAATYRLSVTRGDGATVWSQGSTDTSVALPDSIVLRPHQRYFWVADALLGDGGTRSTGLREFDPVP
jgi:anti-sigma factor RsiW